MEHERKVRWDSKCSGGGRFSHAVRHTQPTTPTACTCATTTTLARLALQLCLAHCLAVAAAALQVTLPLPDRFQWNNFNGYCGETSFIQAGLYYGQYASQFDVRAMLSSSHSQHAQLLLGPNQDQDSAASALRLNISTFAGSAPADFLSFAKAHLVQRHPVIFAVYNSERILYGNTNPDAGDKDYDHIVTAFGIESHFPDGAYHDSDVMHFADHGLFGTKPSNFPVNFSSTFGTFARSRQAANAPQAPVYSLPLKRAYGLAVLGPRDAASGGLLPVAISTSSNAEVPVIKSMRRPPARPVQLTVVVSGLTPGRNFTLSRFSSFAALSAPPSSTSTHRASATTFSFTDNIVSSDQVIWRASVH
jgi:hypothetical protein